MLFDIVIPLSFLVTNQIKIKSKQFIPLHDFTNFGIYQQK